MSIYAIIYLALTAIGMLVLANKHGQPRNDTYSFWYSVGVSVPIWALLYFGGFFRIG